MDDEEIIKILNNAGIRTIRDLCNYTEEELETIINDEEKMKYVKSLIKEDFFIREN